MSHDGILSQEEIQLTAQRRQERIEEDAINAAIERWREEAEHLSKMGIFSALHTRTLASVMWDWHGALKGRIAEDAALLEKSETKEKKDQEDQIRCCYGPFLRLLTPDKLSAITILTVIQILNSQGNRAKITQLAMQIGRALQDETIADEIKRDANKRANRKHVDTVGDSSAADYQYRMGKLLQKSKGHSNAASMRYTSNRLRRSTQFPETRNRAWSEGIKLKTGIVLLSMLLKSAKMPVIRIHPETQESVEQLQPAFQHIQQYVRGHKVGMLLPNGALLEKLSQEPVHSSLAKHLPMVVEPNKWTDFRSGGFLRTTLPAVRIAEGDTDQRQYAMVAAKRGDMDQIFQSLDVLGSVPWKVNRKVFDVLVEAWNTGESFAKIPALHPKFEYPPEPRVHADPKERRTWAYQIKSIENEKSGLHSVRCFYNFQLEIAKAYINETFYFPHNIDFRGRAYPIPPYLNHIGADHARGIMIFAKGKELGESGLQWLKIHLANVYGFDKASLQEREDFAMEHLEDIYDSAENPMTGQRWWLEGEDPWQCLAACMELKSALDSPDPCKFLSCLPVHQDGTCNGLQHYAALGGDYEGAKQVNLVPGEKPADLYTAVAQMVQKALQTDADAGDAVARKLCGLISRKVVKRTVMTNVYGVTFVGAALQVRKELEEILDITEFPKSTQAALSRRIARKVFDALADLFSGAREIQFWLAESANRISQLLTPEQLDQIELQLVGKDKSALVPRKRNILVKDVDYSDFKSSVIWTTPLQMPVVQPYRTTKARIVKTHLQRVNLHSPRRSDPIHKRKQLQGFPPNFIHSLDATHMHLTALQCNELGITFAAVHDSFWTHAADVEKMNVALREAFVRIHSDDIVGRLAAEFEQRHKGAFYMAKVTLGSKTIKAIQEWRRERRSQSDKKHLDELLLERKRQSLLASDDPELLQQAEEIMTPTRMVLEGSSAHGISNEDILDQLDEGRENEDSIANENDLHDHAMLPETRVSADGNALPPTLDEPEAGVVGNNNMSDDASTDEGLTKQQRARKMLKIWMPFAVPPLPKRVRGCFTAFTDMY
jgi:DNA-directed RNA polymerase